VVPKGEARIRIQISAGHETSDLDQAVAGFKKIGSILGLI
jgi:glycine C-acetyltransferase